MDRYEKQLLADSLDQLQGETYANAKAHGFHENESNPLHIPTYLALIGTEVSEAIEAHRKGKINDIPSELADIVIRTLDLAESLKISLANAVLEKHEFNKSRPIKHGNKLY